MLDWLTHKEVEYQEAVAALDLFDASAWLGRTEEFPLMKEGAPALINEVHRRHFINGALVSHWLGESDSSPDINQRLLRDISSNPEWHAVISLNPLYPEDPGCPASPDWIWHQKVKGVRVFPASFNYPLVDWCVGSLCEMLIERHLPLFVFHAQITFRDLYDLAQRYPSLQIVVESQPRKSVYHHRALLPLMKVCPNISLEISNYCGLAMIEYTAKTLGAERLIFGTFAPAGDPLVPIGLIVQANISDGDKKAIAGGNIRRLISEVLI